MLPTAVRTPAGPLVPPALAAGLLALLLLAPVATHAGAFVPGSSTDATVGTGPRAIATADLNGDGRPDMIVGNEGSSGVSVLIGQAGGGFAPAVNYNTGPVPGEVGIADFDGDGVLDFVVGHYNTNTVVIMRGTGTGTFTTGVTLTGPPHPEGLAAADLNGDGMLDLAACGYASSSTGTSSVWLNTGTPGGALAFGSRSDYAVGAWPNSIRAGRFATNRTGLVTANYNGASLTILDNDGTGHFPVRSDLPAPPHVYMAATTELFGDDRAAIVTANADSNSVSVYRWDLVHLVWHRADYATASRPTYVTIADADADGALDVLTSDYVAGQVSIFLVDLHGDLHARVDVPAVTNPYAVAVADFDGDGKPDLVTSNRSGNTVRVVRGLPKAGWGVLDTIPAFTAPNQNGDLMRVGPGSGTWRLLDVSSVWCGASGFMADNVQTLHQRWLAQSAVKFDYLTLLVDGPTAGVPSKRSDAQSWASKHHLYRPILHSDSLANANTWAVARSSDLQATPTLRLVDPAGTVRWVNTGAIEAESTLARIIANVIGVPVPPLDTAHVVSGTLTVSYGAESASTGFDPQNQFFFPSAPAAFGPQFQGSIDLAFKRLTGVEKWGVGFLRWDPVQQALVALPAAQPWQFVFTNLGLDPPMRSLPPGTLADVSVVGADFTVYFDAFTTPVAWDGSTLTIGPIPPEMLAPFGPVVQLYAKFDMNAVLPADVAPSHGLAFALRAPAPNPAVRESKLAWTQPRAGDARVDVYDVGGRLVRTLARGLQPAGEHAVAWDLAGADGTRVGAGLYFARLVVEGETPRVARVTVLR